MIRELPEYWHIPVNEETLPYINAFKATGRAFSKYPIRGGYNYFGLRRWTSTSLAEGFDNYPGATCTELTLKEFRYLVLKDVYSLSVKDRFKLLKI